MFSGRRQPSCDGTSRMTRECQVRICERLGVKFPGPTRQSRPSGRSDTILYVRFTPESGHCELISQRIIVGATVEPDRALQLQWLHDEREPIGPCLGEVLEDVDHATEVR